MNYFISDLHIGHANAIKYDNRPFADITEMNNKIIENWNSRVKTDDTVYILGDFIWAKEHLWPFYVEPLAGKKVLIRGNHDPITTGLFGACARSPLFDVKIEYIISSQDVNVRIHALKFDVKPTRRSAPEETTFNLAVPQDLEEIPRFAMRIPLITDFENLEYFGKGPKENYVAFESHAKMGLWKSTVTDEYEPYIRPQECGNHMGVRMLKVYGQDSIKIDAKQAFEFSALHYTVEELDRKEHAFELEESNSTELVVAYKSRGIGSNCCGPELLDKNRMTDKVIDFNFTLRV